MSCVYGLLNEKADRIKIGISTALRGRIYELSRTEGVDLKCLGAVSGGSMIERTLHREFSAFRLHGEWFARNEYLEKALLHLFETKGVVGEPAIERFTPKANDQRIIADIEDLCVEKASRYFDQIWQPDYFKLKSTDAALKQAAGRLGIPDSLAWRFQYRPPKSIFAGQFFQILAHTDQTDDELTELFFELVSFARFGRSGRDSQHEDCGRAS